ncbi:MAG: hypothetical protein AAGA87_17355 [Pseudomonadota bacterium]
MIGIIGAVGGALYGAWLARRRKGDAGDMAQYAFGFAVAFGFLGVFIGVLIPGLF